MIKKRMQHGDPDYRTTSSQHLHAAAEASTWGILYGFLDDTSMRLS